MPKVSVIMPNFNHARFLRDAAVSVLQQTHGDLELVITDDCSSDNSWQVIESIAANDRRVRMLRHEKNQGLPTSRNDGLKVATGEFIAFCDSDDVWERTKLEMQVKSLESNPTYDVIYGDTWIIDGEGKRTGQRFSELYPLPKEPSGWLFEELVRGNFINVQSALMRQRCLASVDHFDEDLKVLEDWWYWLQLCRTHRFLFRPELVANYRVHSQSMNAMKKRSFPVQRVKIYRRLMRKYTDLLPHIQADIFYIMGVDLCSLGKWRAGRPMLGNAVRCSAVDVRAVSRLCKAAARLAINSSPIRTCQSQFALRPARAKR